jgi:transcriptional regulator with XRE-family HTH domain
LAEYHSSGLSQQAFARSIGISQPTLSYWLRASRRRDGEKVKDIPQLVPVKIKSGPEEQAAPTRPSFELDLPKGSRLWIPVDFDEGALERLLPILADRC